MAVTPKAHQSEQKQELDAMFEKLCSKQYPARTPEERKREQEIDDSISLVNIDER